MNAPTLIIGLGGRGSEVALRVSQMVTEEQRKKIGFAVFDTDVNELRTIKEKNPFVHTIQTSTKISVGEYLDIDTHARDTWFPVNAILNSKTLTEGAGQVRAVSRLAFETAVRAGKMKDLHEAIDELYRLEGEEYQQALRVIIVSSLAGGTGSGLILPVALYVKNYLATKYRQSANITRGFFLLPEIFYHVIPGESERNNLKSNAYATLRELDAFLMKGDATLPEQYKESVKVEFPCVGSGEYEDYDVRPYDFCFLFDAKNVSGGNLNSFEDYLAHAANCIYAQSIGPMNKRSNSSEDNTIRKLCAEKGRNRYAGAGTSMLIYPVEDVKKYLALSWTTEAISKQWRMFDDLYDELLERNRKNRRLGIAVADVNEEECYVQSVEQKAKDNNPFALAIVRSCAKYDEKGINKINDKWVEYTTELVNKIRVENSAGQSALDEQKMAVQAAMKKIRPDLDSEKKIWDQFSKSYHAIQTYQRMVQDHVNKNARTIAYSIFRADSENITRAESKHQLEYYMRDEEGNFLHPNAARYFLYMTLKTLRGMNQAMANEVKKNENEFKKFEKMFDDPDSDDKIETVETIAQRSKMTMSEKMFKKFSADQTDFITAYNNCITAIEAYKVNAIYKAVYEEGIKYVKNMCESFHKFYKSFDGKMVDIERQRKLLESKYNNREGMPASYVCASEKCLKKMVEKMPYDGGTVEIDSALAEAIYTKIHAYSRIEVKNESEHYFSSIFDESILDYFRKQLMELYAPEIDIDIIEAIEREARYEQDIFEDSKIRAYVVKTFNAAKILAEPFIERPMGVETEPLHSCAYNDELDPEDDSPKSMLIRSELKDFGGVDDADVPKNMILFYKSFYGLRANQLSKFAPPQQSETNKRVGGDYYKAYFELVSKIHPVASKSKVITPHIDRWWHTVAMMPDLDDENQRRQEYGIYAALFWGLVGGHIDMYETGYKQFTYRLKVEDVDVDNDSSTLYVSNGTACDKLYEVLDAISIYPTLVENILGRVESTLDAEVNDNESMENSILVKALEKFRVREYPLGDDNLVRSVFDVPLLLKKSMTSKNYDEEKVIEVLKAEINEIKKYISKFCNEKEYPEVAGRIIYEQFEKFLQSLEVEKEKMRDVYHDYLFTRTYIIVAKALEDLGMKEFAREVRNKGDELSK